MAATIRDVAALAGVSPSTVSRTCRNSSSISQKTQERVRQAMAQLGYEPPAIMPVQPETSQRTLGIILPPSPGISFETRSFWRCCRALHSCAMKRKCSRL